MRIQSRHHVSCNSAAMSRLYTVAIAVLTALLFATNLGLHTTDAAGITFNEALPPPLAELESADVDEALLGRVITETLSTTNIPTPWFPIITREFGFFARAGSFVFTFNFLFVFFCFIFAVFISLKNLNLSTAKTKCNKNVFFDRWFPVSFGFGDHHTRVRLGLFLILSFSFNCTLIFYD